MRICAWVVMCWLVAACAARPPGVDRAAVEDYIVTRGLEPISFIRTGVSLNSDDIRPLNDYHMRYRSGQNHYLIAYMFRCPQELGTVSTDVRGGNYLRAKTDTIRGCRIDRIYRLTPEESEEMSTLGTAPAVPQ